MGVGTRIRFEPMENKVVAATVDASTATGKETPRELAEEALQMILGTSNGFSQNLIVKQPIQSIFELAVSPGVANKKFTPKQMITLAEVVGKKE